MRAILIDPDTCTATEVDYTGEFGGAQGACALIGCTLVEAVRLEGLDDMLYLDEDGMLRSLRPPAFFTPLSPSQPFVGRALIIGLPGPDGEATSATLTVARVLDGIERERQEKS